MLLISGDIYPNPGPIDPCSVCSCWVTWGNKSVQCPNCVHFWVYLSCFGLSRADFQKIFAGYCWTCPMCSSFSQTSPSSSQTVSLSSSSNTHKTQKSSSKMNPQSISIINNSLDLPKHLQLTFTYPPSGSFLPPPQSQPYTSLTQSSFHPSLPPKTAYQTSNGMPMEFAHVVLNLYNFFLKSV